MYANRTYHAQDGSPRFFMNAALTHRSTIHPPPLSYFVTPAHTYTCMQRFLNELRADIEKLESEKLRRSLHALSTSSPVISDEGRPLIQFAGNDYLGLSGHPRMKQAVMDAVNELGVGSGASRLVTGTLTVHEAAEMQFAAFKHVEACLILSSGYLSNLAALTSLAERGDLICIDKLSHASLIDASRATGATVRVYPHLHTSKLERLLLRHCEQHARPDHERRSMPQRLPRRFIVTDSVFSMDGDTADLKRLCDLAERYDAILVVDEAHATGVLGATGAGLCELEEVSERVDVMISTTSKALGGIGGAICSSQTVIDTIINRSRPFIYSTAVTPGHAAAVSTAIELVTTESWRRHRLTELSRRVYDGLTALGWHLPPRRHMTPIFPLIVGSAEASLALSDHLRRHGILAIAIRPPTVPPAASRVRISLRADHEDEHIARLLDAVSSY